MASPEAGKVYGCQADRMFDRYQDCLNFLTALQIKYSWKKLIFYEIQCKMKGIPHSRTTLILILRLPLIVLLTKIC